MNNIQQVLQQPCDYGEHEFTIALDGKKLYKVQTARSRTNRTRGNSRKS